MTIPIGAHPGFLGKMCVSMDSREFDVGRCFCWCCAIFSQLVKFMSYHHRWRCVSDISVGELQIEDIEQNLVHFCGHLSQSKHWEDSTGSSTNTTTVDWILNKTFTRSRQFIDAAYRAIDFVAMSNMRKTTDIQIVNAALVHLHFSDFEWPWGKFLVR